MRKKTGAAAVQHAALGHNNDELVKVTMQKFAEQERIISEAKERQKQALREGKEGGVLKTSIRKAFKDLQMTSEQKQAHDEVEAERERYKKVCAEIGLFDHMEGDKEAA